MLYNRRNNRRREPKLSQMDNQGWASLLKVVAVFVFSCSAAIAIPYAAYRFYSHLADTDFFAPKNISISGNLRASDEDILEASGLKLDGSNLVEVKLSTIAESIQTLDWIKKAEITVHFPDTIEIAITEHQALGIVNDGRLMVVDNDGKFIKFWALTDDLTQPIVSLDKNIDIQADAVIEAFDLSKRIEQSGYPHRIQEIHYDDATGFTAYTQTTEIRLAHDQFDQRIEKLNQLNDILEKQGVVPAYILLDAAIRDDNGLEQAIVKALINNQTQASTSESATASIENLPEADKQKPIDGDNLPLPLPFPLPTAQDEQDEVLNDLTTPMEADPNEP